MVQTVVEGSLIHSVVTVEATVRGAVELYCVIQWGESNHLPAPFMPADNYSLQNGHKVESAPFWKQFR